MLKVLSRWSASRSQRRPGAQDLPAAEVLWPDWARPPAPAGRAAIQAVAATAVPPPRRRVDGHVRARVHALCALYAHARTPDRRTQLLDQLETVILDAAEALARTLAEEAFEAEAG